MSTDPQDFNDIVRQLILALGTSVHHCNENINNLAQGMWNSQATLHHGFGVMQQGFASVSQGTGSGGQGSSDGYRALKPKKDMTKVKAQDARSLMIELAQFEVDLGELGVPIYSEASYRQLRAMVDGKAKEVVDLQLVMGDGKLLATELERLVVQLGTKDQRDNIGGRLYAFLVGHLQKAVRLTPERRLQIAESVYAEATMQGDSVAEAELFLSKWRRARHLMYKEGLVSEFTAEQNYQELLGKGCSDDLARRCCEPQLIQEKREMNTFLEQRVSKSIYQWIRAKDPTAEKCQNVDMCIAAIESWIDVHARDRDTTNRSGGIRTFQLSDSSGEGLPGVLPYDEEQSSERASRPTDHEVPGDKEAGSINAFQQGNSGYMGSSSGHRPGSKGSGRPQGPGSRSSTGSGPGKGSGPVCPTCKGHHPELRNCPNGIARQDASFTPGGDAKCRWKMGNGPPCGGCDHFSRHHAQQWTQENPGKPLPVRKSKGKGKGKVKGKRVSKRISAVILEDGSYWDDLDDNDIDYDGESDDYDGEAVGGYSEPEAAGTAAESPSAHIAVGRESAPIPEVPVGRADAWYKNGYASASDSRGFRSMTFRRIAATQTEASPLTSPTDRVSRPATDDPSGFECVPCGLNCPASEGLKKHEDVFNCCWCEEPWPWDDRYECILPSKDNPSVPCAHPMCAQCYEMLNHKCLCDWNHYGLDEMDAPPPWCTPLDSAGAPSPPPLEIPPPTTTGVAATTQQAPIPTCLSDAKSSCHVSTLEASSYIYI